ncbi:hypothetical protein WDU94_000168, partial [Cyamophila willieti]
MTSLICRRYLCLQRTWNVRRKHASNCIGIASNLTKTLHRSRFLITSKPSHGHFNFIAALSSTIQFQGFATKQREDVANVIEQQTRGKGDIAFIVHHRDEESSRSESNVERLSLDQVNERIKVVDRFNVNNSGPKSHLNNFVEMYKKMTGKEMNLNYTFSRCSSPDASEKDMKKGKTPQPTHWACLGKIKIPVAIEVKTVGHSSKGAAGDLVAKLILSELF